METILWGLWLVMFTVIEVPALLDDEKGDTFSEHIWNWFAVKGKPKWWRLRRFALLSAVAWLALHFLTGGAF